MCAQMTQKNSVPLADPSAFLHPRVGRCVCTF